MSNYILLVSKLICYTFVSVLYDNVILHTGSFKFVPALIKYSRAISLVISLMKYLDHICIYTCTL